MAAIDDLEDYRDSIVAELKAMYTTAGGGAPDVAKAGAKPDVSGGGDRMHHIEYRQMLMEQLKEINVQISALEGAFEVTSEAAV